MGKTTLLLELAAHYGDRAIYAAADTLEAGLPGFWERLVERAESEARTRRKAVLLIDEVQHLADWAARLKSEWDRLRRVPVPLQIVATGSSALSIGSGSRESLAGRFERINLSHWSASELVELLGARSTEAPSLVARMGSYPGAFTFRKNAARWRAYIRDAIIEPAIGRDVLALGSVRRPALLRQVFALCADMPAQVVSLQKLQGQLRDPGALETIAHYLHILEEAYLIAALEKYSTRALRQRKSPPKLIMLNNAFLSAMHPEGIPDRTTEPARFGTWVENACLAHAWNAGQRVAYWREEPLEVDAVFEGSWGAWAVEIKTGRLDTASLRGLLEFCRRNRKFRPLVLSGRGGSSAARRAGIEVMPWERFLLNGPPKGNKPPTSA